MQLRSVTFISPFLTANARWCDVGWLVKVGRIDEARQILANLRADGDVNNEAMIQEFDDILEIAALEKKHHARNTYFSMLFGIGMRSILILM